VQPGASVKPSEATSGMGGMEGMAGK